MKKPDEIKKGLECCADPFYCDRDCPYYDDCNDGKYSFSADALALIQQLQSDNAQLNRCIENMTDKLNALNDEVAKLQAERDAAVNALRLVQEKHEEAVAVIDDDVFPLVDYDVYCHLRDAVDDMMSWEVESDSRGVQKEDDNA